MRISAYSGLAIVGVFVGSLTASIASGAAKDSTPPQIAECRIGFDGRFKVGVWTPVRVTLSGDLDDSDLRVRVTTVDSDGVPVSVTKPVEPTGNTAEGEPRALLYAKVGRIDAPVHVDLLSEDWTVVDKLALASRANTTMSAQFRPMAATSELLVQLGAVELGIEDAYLSPGDDDGRAFVKLLDVNALPTDWFGYEGVDVLVLMTADAGQINRLAGDRRRLQAIQKWVESGGRLLVAGGGGAADKLLAIGGPLAEFVPGRFTEMVRLPETAPLEHFARSEVPLTTGSARTSMTVPQIVDVVGNVEVYAGQRSSDLPLIVRTARGLGEVAFIGVDLTASPLKDWPGRKPLLQAVLRPFLTQRDDREAAQSLVARGYNDLSGALRQNLGRSFAGVMPMSFSVVTLMAIAYLLVLGPVDFLIVRRWLRRPRAAWITFPLIVLFFGLMATSVGDWRRTAGRARINQLELVDVDTTTGHVRGSFWGTLYSPSARRFDLALNVDYPDDSNSPRGSEVLLSWWGLPGLGVGGMQSTGTDLDIVGVGYHYGDSSQTSGPIQTDRFSDKSKPDPGLNSLINMPVLTAATKSLQARWTASSPDLINAQLTDADGLVTGSVENHSSMPLRNLRLLYNSWAYRLGNLEPGGRIDVGDEISPRRVKTVVMQDAAGPALPGREDRSVFAAEQATAGQILNLMMFYQAAGGFAFAGLANDYQAHFDLSRMLVLGRAILVAEVPNRGSRLVDAATGEPVGKIDGDQAVVYRFVMPVAKNEGTQ